MTILQDFLAWLTHYIPIIVGLFCGSFAHFGRKIMLGGRPTRTEITGFIMQLGFIALVASVGTRMLNMSDDDTRALATALLALSVQEVIEHAKRSGWGPFAKAAIPGTIEGERKQAEQLSQSASYIIEKGLVDEAIKRTAAKPKKEGTDA